MVNIFGEPTTSGGNSRPGKRGLPGKDGAPGRDGKRGKPGEDASFYEQCFQHSKTKWDVDYEPNFWTDGYDIQKAPFKVLTSIIMHTMQLYPHRIKNLQRELIQVVP